MRTKLTHAHHYGRKVRDHLRLDQIAKQLKDHDVEGDKKERKEKKIRRVIKKALKEASRIKLTSVKRHPIYRTWDTDETGLFKMIDVKVFEDTQRRASIRFIDSGQPGSCVITDSHVLHDLQELPAERDEMCDSEYVEDSYTNYLVLRMIKLAIDCDLDCNIGSFISTGK